MQKSLAIGRRAFGALAAITLLAACGRAVTPAAQPAAPAADQPKADAPAAPAANKPVIKLVENPWTGSTVNVYVAKEILESKLGYKVEIVAIDENAMWPAMAKNDLSAALEVWPSVHPKDKEQYIDSLKQIEDLGALGVVGRIGWYVPTYVIDAHPELATWEGYKKPELAALFKTAQSGEQGTFYQGDPSWGYYEKDIFKNLGINDFKIVQAGSEDALIAAVDAAYKDKKPIIFYYWQPNWPFAKYQLSKVKLPDYTDACYAKAADGSVACEYPEDPLYKIASPKLKTDAPDAYALLKKMKYSNDDQIKLIGSVVIDKLSPADAAKKWVAENESVWKAWMP